MVAKLYFCIEINLLSLTHECHEGVQLVLLHGGRPAHEVDAVVGAVLVGVAVVLQGAVGVKPAVQGVLNADSDTMNGKNNRSLKRE